MQCIVLCIIIESILYLLEIEEKLDVTLPWSQNFRLATTGSSSDDGDNNENGKKAIGLLC